MEWLTSFSPAGLSGISRRGSVVAIGSYDGLHVGHRSILNPMIAQARASGRTAVLVSFDPVPAVFFGRLPEDSMILLPEERAEIAAALGIDVLITLPFTAALARQSAESFISELTAAVTMRELWVGSGFSLGHERTGSAAALRSISERYGYAMNITARIRLADGEISSSRIRAHLSDGEVSMARALLTYPFFIGGRIEPGAQLGTKIGIPTLNLQYAQRKIRLAHGVYVTRTRLDGETYDSVTSIGVRPTFYSDSGVVIETYLLDRTVEAYGKEARIDFYEFIRPEEKFSGSAELVAQINRDISFARGYLAEVPPPIHLALMNDLPYQSK